MLDLHSSTEYEHAQCCICCNKTQKHEEPLLWVADAIAWCIQRGQPWANLVVDLIDD